jgi:hypothetical protein
MGALCSKHVYGDARRRKKMKELGRGKEGGRSVDV